jgi:hypothetical protein
MDAPNEKAAWRRLPKYLEPGPHDSSGWEDIKYGVGIPLAVLGFVGSIFLLLFSVFG